MFSTQRNKANEASATPGRGNMRAQGAASADSCAVSAARACPCKRCNNEHGRGGFRVRFVSQPHRLSGLLQWLSHSLDMQRYIYGGRFDESLCTVSTRHGVVRQRKGEGGREEEQ